MKKEERRLRIGLLGCGPISQAAHLDAIRKARNGDLYAICDVAKDLTQRIAAIYQPTVVYHDLAAMLNDPNVEAVVIAVADQYHVPLCRTVLAAGKHVLIEKPLGTTVEECESLRVPLRASGLTLQIGNNRRFEPQPVDAAAGGGSRRQRAAARPRAARTAPPGPGRHQGFPRTPSPDRVPAMECRVLECHPADRPMAPPVLVAEDGGRWLGWRAH